jgi:hypothetical protein
MVFYPGQKLRPPSYVTSEHHPRWYAIVRQRERCEWWLLAAGASRFVGAFLAVGTLIVASIAAGRPGFISGIWTESEIRSWATAVAILSGLSGLIPWQKFARAYERAHEKLIDAITLYDEANSNVTVLQVVDAANEASKLLPFRDDSKPSPIQPHGRPAQHPPARPND